jgi:UDP-N-acetylglucosamine 2-epimerase
MAGTFFRELGLPNPDATLKVGSGTHAVQTARLLERFDEDLRASRPDLVVVVGDVNSTLACAVSRPPRRVSGRADRFGGCPGGDHGAGRAVPDTS